MEANDKRDKLNMLAMSIKHKMEDIRIIEGYGDLVFTGGTYLVNRNAGNSKYLFDDVFTAEEIQEINDFFKNFVDNALERRYDEIEALMKEVEK